MIQETSLKELMHLTQQGNQQAYAQLLQHSSDLARGYLYSRINNPEDIEDVTQEILIAIDRAKHTYNKERPFKPWFFAIAHHKLQDYLRKLYRTREWKEVDFKYVENFITDHVTDTEEKNELLTNLMKPLSKKQQQAIRLMKIQGYSAKETGDKLGMKESAVKVMIHRALKKIQKSNQSA